MTNDAILRAGPPSGAAEGPRSRARFRATPEAEGRLLLLIDAFSRSGQSPRALEGRVKLAKLDFLLRYPRHLLRVLAFRNVAPRVIEELALDAEGEAPIDARMMRYRYGPWDPAYYAILGSLIGRGLVTAIPLGGRVGIGYRTTAAGADAAKHLAEDDSFATVAARTFLLRRHLDLTGTKLKDLLYELPEVADAAWHEELT